MELIKSRGYNKQLQNFSGQNTELWDFVMKIPNFVLKNSVNFTELCSVIAYIPASWLVP